MKRAYLLVVSFFLLSSLLLGQDISVLKDSATVRLARQLALYPQEKIYIQTDKTGYLSGERIWFRAHVLDALDNRPSYISRYVYVELVNPFNELVMRIKIRPDSIGVFAGQLDLEEDLPEGDYTMRAYTRFTRNQGEETFFRKMIRVMDPYSLQMEVQPDFIIQKNSVEVRFRFVDRASGDNIVPESVTTRLAGMEARTLRATKEGLFEVSFSASRLKESRCLLLGIVREGRRYNRFYTIPYVESDVDIAFFPEGGYLVPGHTCWVAFKAVNPSGLGEDVKGVIYNSKGEEVTSFQSSLMGMGAFSLLTVPSETYHAVCETKGGLFKRVDLPIPEPKARVLSARQVRGRLIVSVLDGSNAGDPLSLLIHNNGIVLYHEPWQLGKTSYSFPSTILPSGVSSVLLLDEKLNILSERLVFNLNEDDFSKVLRRDSISSYKRRELVSLRLQLDNVGKVTSHNSMAISVVDANAVPMDSVSDLVSTLLLSSELKGYVESPARYLSGGKLETAALDALMMTQGWRRYDIPRVLKGEYETPDILPERFQEISGKAIAMLLNKMEGGTVSLIAKLDTLFSMETTSADKEGRFQFSVEFPEGTEIVVQTMTSKDRASNYLEMDTVVYPSLSNAAMVSRGALEWREKLQSSENGNDIDAYLRQANEEYLRKYGIRTVMLGEVTVTAPKVKTYKESAWYSPISSSPPMTAEEIERKNFSSIEAVLLNTSGLTISNGKISTTRSDMPVLIVIDDVPMPDFDVSTLTVDDIDNLFVIKDYTAMFGIYPGTSGALVITTREGFVQRSKSHNIRRFTPLGYQLPAEFYSPRYDTPELQDSPEPDFRTTIYWKPDVHFSQEGEAVVEFYTADTPGTYRIIGEGVTGSGKLISFKEEIKIDRSVK